MRGVLEVAGVVTIFVSTTELGATMRVCMDALVLFVRGSGIALGSANGFGVAEIVLVTVLPGFNAARA